VLYETIKALFPDGVDPDSVIRHHVWRNEKYVGQPEGKVWGFSHPPVCMMNTPFAIPYSRTCPPLDVRERAEENASLLKPALASEACLRGWQTSFVWDEVVIFREPCAAT
jgi:hypothetical protein